MDRPRVSLDAVAAGLDRLLAHPLMGLVEQMSPDAVEALRELRGDLPAAASGLERLAVERMMGAGKRIADDLGRELRDAVARAVWAGQRAPAGRRLPAAKKKRKGRKR